MKGGSFYLKKKKKPFICTEASNYAIHHSSHRLAGHNLNVSDMSSAVSRYWLYIRSSIATCAYWLPYWTEEKDNPV